MESALYGIARRRALRQGLGAGARPEEVPGLPDVQGDLRVHGGRRRQRQGRQAVVATRSGHAATRVVYANEGSRGRMAGMDLIPAPRRLTRQDGSEPFVADRPHHAGRRPRHGPARRAGCARCSAPPSGWPARPRRRADSVLRLRLDGALAPRRYRLHVGRRRGRADRRRRGAASSGRAQTLRQLLGPDAFRRAPLRGRAGCPPCRRSPSRTPRGSAWRGFLLDVARHFLPKDVVLRYVDLLAGPQAQRAAPAPDRRPGLADGDRCATRG